MTFFDSLTDNENIMQILVPGLPSVVQIQYSDNNLPSFPIISVRGYLSLCLDLTNIK